MNNLLLHLATHYNYNAVRQELACSLCPCSYKPSLCSKCQVIRINSLCFWDILDGYVGPLQMSQEESRSGHLQFNSACQNHWTPQQTEHFNSAPCLLNTDCKALNRPSSPVVFVPAPLRLCTPHPVPACPGLISPGPIQTSDTTNHGDTWGWGSYFPVPGPFTSPGGFTGQCPPALWTHLQASGRCLGGSAWCPAPAWWSRSEPLAFTSVPIISVPSSQHRALSGPLTM